ncbi:terminase large subunit domain-containing protein [Halomonas sp.]|uniref:terminase large subunit domain-containing protein n=1 Tax=Halomonas sp. TaxID=1486246 RepID=UPI0035692B68
MDGLGDLAERFAEHGADIEDAEAILERWTGHPEKIAEDIFRVRSQETHKIEPLRLFYPYQPKLMHAYFYGDSRLTNVYKGRRIGVSFIFCVCIAIDALAHGGTNYAIVSRTKAQSEARISDIADLLSESKLGFTDLDADLPTNNNGELEFPNGANIKAFTGEPDGARGFDSAKVVFVDEMAFLDDQKATMRAFMPFINLGDAQMLQVSTPRVANDTFLQTHRNGTEQGKDGVISIKQPSFKNPEEIDPTKSLFDQDAVPVRPDMNVQAVEVERAQDPQGFAQEYLCQPVSDEYRFLSKQKVGDAMRRGAAMPENYELGTSNGGRPTGQKHYWHPATHARCGGMMSMGVDIGTDGADDTAITVFEHVGEERYLRFHTLLDRSDLRALDVYPEDTANPESVANYVYRLAENMGVDKVFIDMTGPGKGFQKSIQQRLGNRAQGFNFSDKKELERMWGDLNYGFHKNLVHLVPDEDLFDQLCAIVKQQSYKDQTPRFSGKDQAEDGKDDLAMATVLGAYPPHFDANRSTEAHARENVSGESYSDEAGPQKSEGEKGTRELRVQNSQRRSYGDDVQTPGGVVRLAGGTSKRSQTRYQNRHNRSNSRRRY